MPPRRRVTPAAAGLPANRLPLGTPHLGLAFSPSNSQNSSKSPTRRSNQYTSRSDDSDPLADSGQEATVSKVKESSSMPPSNSNRAPAVSMAEAKLERQRKRIEEADASLNAPHPTDRRGQAARGKAAKWKPFDFTADSASSNLSDAGGVPVSASDVRVNTIRPPPRPDSSMSRPMSVMSYSTNDTGPSDMERQDSGLNENGFQVYTGRSRRKKVGEWGGYDDKADERQMTVEATFDSRETYNVFGNALPGPEFIVENAGFKNGQLQFVQHPNGDVSAHQWSTERFQWENIGQFSSIRKKVEGQLASDRLKGETAHQTLQQNTLAYFRIIAKQREANVMNLPFGTKEIQAALPEPPVQVATATTGLKEDAKDTSATGSPRSQTNTPAHHHPLQNYQLSLREPRGDSASQADSSQNNPQAPNAGPYGYAQNYGVPTAKQDDPFYSTGSYQQIYGGYSDTNKFYGQGQYQSPYLQAYPRQYQSTASNVARGQGLNYDFHFPPTNGSTRSSQISQSRQGRADRYNGSETAQNRRQQDDASQTMNSSSRNYQQHLPSRGYHGSATQANDDTTAAHTQYTIAYNPRTAARDQLWKLPETAKERSLSQANIRTVLYDPLQSQLPAEKPIRDEDSVKQHDESSAFARNIAGNALQPPKSFDTNSTKFFPTVLAPQSHRSSSPEPGKVENNLQDSSPDPPRNKAYNHTMPSNSSASKPTPQTFQGPFFPGNENSRSSMAASSEDRSTSQDDLLKEWWTSGNKFARQQELFEGIQKSREDTQSTFSSPPAHLTPIGPPSRTLKKQNAQSSSDAMTRILIPVLENLSSYVQGPVEKRRDYFSQWSKPPDWCIDRSEKGNDSFFDKDWGTPPSRVGRDPRYSNRGWSGEQLTPQRGRFGGAGVAYGNGMAVGQGIPGLDRRFGFGGRY